MTSQRPCAVIYNPVKVSDGFREAAAAALESAGRTDVRWWQTTEDDPGRGMVQEALAASADLVLVAGGDGTVRVVADGLAGTDVVLGIVPEGTANLLALNLGIPSEEAAALQVIMNGKDRRIDLIRVSVDNEPAQHSAVMAGAGLDAMIMGDTDDQLKAKIGSAAYFLAAGKALGRLPLRARIRIDNHYPRRRRAMVVILGNVGRIPGIDLIPNAKPDDGRMDVLIASPRRFRDWVKVAIRLITRRPKVGDTVEIRPARRVELRIGSRDHYQLDGDVVGEFSVMRAEIVPGALVVRVPDDEPAAPPG